MLTPLRNEALKYFEIMVQQIAVVVLKKCKKEFEWDVFFSARTLTKKHIKKPHNCS